MESRQSRGRSTRRGFTLIEVIVAALIVGLVFVALMEAFRSGIMLVGQSEEQTKAAELADQIHEVTLTMSMTNVLAMNGQTYSPPIDATQAPMNSLNGYTQQVTVVSVADNNYNQIVSNGSSNTARVTVAVTCHGNEVSRLSWIIMGH